jgi:hypothetical protein
MQSWKATFDYQNVIGLLSVFLTMKHFKQEQGEKKEA